MLSSGKIAKYNFWWKKLLIGGYREYIEHLLLEFSPVSIDALQHLPVTVLTILVAAQNRSKLNFFQIFSIVSKFSIFFIPVKFEPPAQPDPAFQAF